MATLVFAASFPSADGSVFHLSRGAKFIHWPWSHGADT